MKWSDIPVAAKMAVAAVGACMSVVVYLTTFQTDAEAQQYQQQHQSELVRFRVQQIENQISQYRYQLLSSQLNPAQREWILQEISKLQKLIDCIRAGRC